MFDLVEKLQKKPESARRVIVLIAAGAITIVIFVVWLTTLGTRSFSIASGVKDNAEVSPLSSVTSGFSRLFGGFGEQLDGLGTFVEDMQLESPAGSSRSGVIIEE